MLKRQVVSLNNPGVFSLNKINRWHFFLVKYKRLIYYNCLYVFSLTHLSTRNILKCFMRLLIGEMQIYRAGKDHSQTGVQNSGRFYACWFLFQYAWVLSQNHDPGHAPVSLAGGAVSLSSKPTEQGPLLTRKLSDFSVFRQKWTIHTVTFGLFPLTRDQPPSGAL